MVGSPAEERSGSGRHSRLTPAAWQAAAAARASRSSRRRRRAATGAEGGRARAARAGSAFALLWGVGGPEAAAAMVVLASASHGRMGHAGPSGLERAQAVRTGSGLGARPVRNRIVFFFFFFFFHNLFPVPKQFQQKHRNCLKARKILRKSQKFPKNS
jgi:hypothetical protein